MSRIFKQAQEIVVAPALLSPGATSVLCPDSRQQYGHYAIPDSYGVYRSNPQHSIEAATLWSLATVRPVQLTDMSRFFQVSSFRSVASKYCASESLGMSPGQSLRISHRCL